jgi:6-phosphogluconate dehydrogenase
MGTITANEREELGIIGLGRMGGSLALQARDKGFRVVGVDKGAVSRDLQGAGVVAASSLEELCRALRRPRKVFLYIPSGAAVDGVIDSLVPSLESGDVIADGGNSYWGDSVARFERLKPTGIHFVDLGTSGGVTGARNGACFMAGGEAEPIRLLEPILMRLAVEGGYVHAGPPGAGHFTKLCHNGIEFGMLQAIGEGVNLLAHHKDRLDIAAILHCWRNGSVIRSWLVDLMEAAFRQEGGLARVSGYVDDTGEVNWLVADALRMEVPIPVIAQSVMQIFLSRDSDKSWAKAIAMMRHGFGGHAYGPSAAARNERVRGRREEISPEPPPPPPLDGPGVPRQAAAGRNG